MASYGQFCPVAKAVEVLGERWTLLVVRELLGGSSRFGELQRGVPGCPPATLAKRLRRLASAGVVERVQSSDGHRYELTEAGRELYPLLEGLGVWGQRWARSTYSPDELHADLLLWDLRRFLDPAGLGVDKAVIELRIRRPGLPDQLFWLVVQPGGVDLCLTPIERPVDVVLDAHLLALTRIWMGDDSWAAAESRQELRVSGPTRLTARLPDWIGHHPVLAAVPRAPRDQDETVGAPARPHLLPG